ncbi:MAG: hypothetical protein WC356_07765 [Candidatus Micrarchaeia archaeon]|jgi:apolipoprotein N-acyltransferase
MVTKKTKRKNNVKKAPVLPLGQFEMLKREVVLAGFFVMATGLIWFFTSAGYFDITGFEVAGPFIIIVLGFLIAISSAKK